VLPYDKSRRSTKLLDREYPGQDCPKRAADGVDSERVEGVIVAEQVFEAGETAFPARDLPA
jgi:hypothetical protein